MSSIKFKKMIYVTQKDKERIRQRAKALGMADSAYLTELSMWEARHNLLPKLREGGVINTQ